MILSARMLDENEVARWDAFVSAQHNGTVFNTCRWLRPRGGDGFHVLVCERGGEWLGGFAFVINHRLGLQRIVQPVLTVYHAPVVLDALCGERNDTLRSEVLRTIFQALPAYDSLTLRFPPQFPVTRTMLELSFDTYVTRTNRICPPKDRDALLAGYSRNARHELINAAHGGLEPHQGCGLDEVHRLASLSMRHAGRRVPLGVDELTRWLAPFGQDGELVTMGVRARDGMLVAAALLACDTHTCYGLLSGVDRAASHASCGLFLMHHCILHAMERNLCFDFAGSMLPGVAAFIQKFGPTPCEVRHYFHARTRRIRMLNTFGRGIGHRLY